MRQCLECNTFHFTDEAKTEFDKDEFNSLKDKLHKILFQTSSMEEEIDIESDENDVKDSILNAYKQELEKIPECRSAKLTLARVNQSDLAWIMSKAGAKQTSVAPQVVDEVEDEQEIEEFEDIYECVLECQSYRKAEAKPLNEKKRIVVIRGSGNRIPAFNGDTVRIGIFLDNPKDKCYGKVLEVISRGHEPRFLCRVSQRNPVLFFPIDEMNPVFCNLPRISRDLLKQKR